MLLQHNTDVETSIGVIGFQARGLPVRCERRFQPALFLQDFTEIVVIGGDLRFARNRLSKQCGRIPWSSSLVSKNAEKVEGVSVRGILRKNLLVDLFRLQELACLV